MKGRFLLVVSLILILSGGSFAMTHVTMISIWQDILKAIGSVTGTDNYDVNFTVAFLISVLIPIGLLLGTAKLATFIGGSVEKIKKNFIRLGYAIIPLDLA